MPELSLPVAFAAFAVAGGVILLAGPRMVVVARAIAKETRLGEAVIGAFFVGAATSLPDAVATVTPAIAGLPDLAVGNALGGVVGQTAFLAVADVTYRSGRLARVATSKAGLVQGVLLIALLGLVLALVQSPQGGILGVHPGTLVLILIYAYGIRMVARASHDPSWPAAPRDEEESLDESLSDESVTTRPVKRLWRSFAILSLVLGGAGYILIPAAERIVAETGLSRTAVGASMTGIASSLAELVVSIAAVRAGAFALAVGNVFGGNMFDATLVGVADIAYTEGPIYAALSPDHTLLAAAAVFVTAVTLLGLLRRGGGTIAGAGRESIVVLVAYVLALVLVTT